MTNLRPVIYYLGSYIIRDLEVSIILYILKTYIFKVLKRFIIKVAKRMDNLMVIENIFVYLYPNYYIDL